MKSTRSLLLLLAALPAFAPAETGLVQFMPSNTHMAFWIEDLSKAREEALLNPGVKLAMDDEYGVGTGPDAVTRALDRLPISMIDPLGGVWSVLLPSADLGIRSGVEASTSVFQFTPGEVLDTFSGDFGLYSSLYNLYVADGIEIVEWDLILAAEIREGGREKAERFLENSLKGIPAEAKRSSTNYFGRDVFHIEYFLEESVALPGDDETDLGLVEEIPVIVEYAWVDNYLLMAEGRGKPLERSLRAYNEQDPRFTLSRSEGFVKASKALGETGGRFVFFMDLAHHVREWRDFPSLTGDVRLMTALGLQNAGPLLLRSRVDETGIRTDLALLTPAEPDGVLQMLATAPRNELRGLELVPADAESFGTLSMDMKALYRQIRAAMAVIQPRQRAVTDAVLKAIEAATAVNLERDLLEGSKGEMVTYLCARPSADGTPGGIDFGSAVIFPLKGEAETIALVNGLVEKLSSETVAVLDLESTDQDGIRIWETPLAPDAPARPGSGLYFAHTPRGLATATSGAELRDLLRRSSDGGSAVLANSPRFAAVAAKVEDPNLRGFHYTSAGAVLEDLERARQRSPSLPPIEILRNAIGDSWWTLRVSEGQLLLAFVFDAPTPPPPTQ